MLVVFSPIFVADTKIIFRYDFVAPLNICPKERRVMPCVLMKVCEKFSVYSGSKIFLLMVTLYIKGVLCYFNE